MKRSINGLQSKATILHPTRDESPTFSDGHSPQLVGTENAKLTSGDGSQRRR